MLTQNSPVILKFTNSFATVFCLLSVIIDRHYLHAKRQMRTNIHGNMSSFKMFYGNMLYSEVGDVDMTDEDVQQVVKFASEHLNKLKRYEKMKASNLYQEVKVQDLKKYKLVYSSDDKEPYSFHTPETAVQGGREIDHEGMLAYMGLWYKFTLQWGTETHQLEISRYTPGDTHIYTHTIIGQDYLTCTSPSTQEDNKPGQNPSKLSVLSQNIWNFFTVENTEEDYVRRINILGQVLKSTGAGIIGFQEVRYQHGSGLYLGPNQMSHLMKYLPGYQYVFQPAMTQARSLNSGRCEEGLAIFSKYPILDYSFKLLDRNYSDPDDTHQRICLRAKVDVPMFGKVNVFVSHLSLSERAREKSVVEIWNYMQEYDGTAFLLGDLNAAPHEDSIKFLHGEVSLTGSKVSGLEDCWLMKNKEEESGGTFSSLKEKPHKRIDYVFLCDSLQIFSVDNMALIGSGSTGLGAASDHFGVLATFGKRSPRNT